MKEVFLYMCEECGMCMFESRDKGTASYNNYCAGCKQASFFQKIVIVQGSFMVLENKVEEKKNG
jgi:hypothetical protein